MKIQVLDHGYVEFVEAWGVGKEGRDDAVEYEDYQHFAIRQDDFEVGIIEAARQSTQGSFRGWDQDAKLLKYLHDHKHATPFEFAGMVLEVQAPIFVFREWHRHRTQSYNEMSARYSPLPDLYYMPDQENVYDRMQAATSTSNRQATGIGQLTQENLRDMKHVTAQWLQNLDRVYQECEMLYKQGLEAGVPKELARLIMPVGHYSKMRASANLRNWLSFLTLRMDPAAQYEIRQYANAVAECVQQTFPQTWKLFASAL